MPLRLVLTTTQLANIRVVISPLAAVIAGHRPEVAASSNHGPGRQNSYGCTERHRNRHERLVRTHNPHTDFSLPAPSRSQTAHSATSTACDIDPERWWQYRSAPELASLQILENDLIYRMQRVATGGVSGLFGDLHHAVRLDDDVLHIDTDRDATVCCDGQRLVLMPSLHEGSQVFLVADPAASPLLVYPARGAGEHLDSRRPTTADLVFDWANCSTLSLLAQLDTPRTAEQLAAMHRTSVRLVSDNLTFLCANGLARRSSDTNNEFQRTTLADLVVSRSSAGPAELSHVIRSDS